MNLKRMMALVLALTMVFALAACGGKGGDNTTGSTNGTTGSTNGAEGGNAVYTVKVADVLGNPYTENIVVLFLQNGTQVAMQPIGADGTVSKELPKGDYEVQLQITKDAEKYHYAAEALKLTAEVTSLEITMSKASGNEFEFLTVNGMERELYKLVFNADGTFTLDDLVGDMDGTYKYTANADGGYDVTNEAGEAVGMFITLNLDDTYAFMCEGVMSYGQTMVQDGEVTEELSGSYTVVSNEYKALVVNVGCTYLELNASHRNYFIFTPLQAGIYEFTVHNAAAAVGYYGSPYFTQVESSGTVTGEQAVSVEIKESMLGNSLVIGIDADAGNDGCVLSVVRIGDPVLTPDDMPWDIYEGTHTPTKYSLPAGLAIQEFDLSASYALVYNETDGFYHLDTADGPVVLVRLWAVLPYGGSFGHILANSNVGAYFYDEEGTFLNKELYNNCLLTYLGTLNKGMGTFSYSGGMLDDTFGVYPLTKDLEHIIKSYGDYIGWWDANDGNYLFGSVPNVNIEMAWLFMCCFAK